MVLTQAVSKEYSFNFNINAYRNQIDAFTVNNKYPTSHTFTSAAQEIFSGSMKMNNTFHFKHKLDAQLTAVYLAPDIIPQGKIKARFSLDLGIKKEIQKGKGELFVNATDLLNTMVIKKVITGNGFVYTSNDFYETQVFRLGYGYKF
jgi:hypothetical protein